MKKIALTILNSDVVKKVIGEQLQARLGGETPKFFKKVQAVGLVLGVVAAAVAAAPVSATVATIAAVFVGVGGAMVTIAQTTVVNPEALPKKPLPNNENQ